MTYPLHHVDAHRHPIVMAADLIHDPMRIGKAEHDSDPAPSHREILRADSRLPLLTVHVIPQQLSCSVRCPTSLPPEQLLMSHVRWRLRAHWFLFHKQINATYTQNQPYYYRNNY